MYIIDRYSYNNSIIFLDLFKILFFLKKDELIGENPK